MRHPRFDKPCATALAFLCATLVVPDAGAAEGMWTLDNLPYAELAKTYEFKPDADWVAKVMHASLRDEGGCSASFISPNGLVMTNHHCVEECVGQLSTAKHDLQRDGFLAKTGAEERRCPDFALDRLDKITDVTSLVGKAGEGLNGAAFTSAQRAEVARLTSECAGKDAATRCDVVDLYGGAVHHLYRYHRFSDVRLVFAPEYDVAQFGGDPDNFNFPRYDMDIGVVRAYENGQPVHGNEFLRFSKAGAQPGDLTITSGHPGGTQRQLTVAQLEQLRDDEFPWRVTHFAELRGLLNRFAAESPEHAREAKEEIDGVENAFKALYAELDVLRDPAVFAVKRADEARLRAFAQQHPELQADVGAWDEIAAAQKTTREMAMRYRYTEGRAGIDTTYFNIARDLVRAANERALPDAQRLPGFTDTALPAAQDSVMSPEPIAPALEQVKLAWSLTKLREWLGADDPLVRQVLGRESPEVLAARWIKTTKLGNLAYRKQLWQGGKAAIAASDDPFIRVALIMEPESRALRKRRDDEVLAVEHKNAERIAQVRFAQSGTTTYPDATFTLRLSFGIVEGWQRRGEAIGPYTTVGGLFDRATGYEPFKLPASWLSAKPRLDPALRMDFVTTNDIVGGNSGSPVLDRNGEIVGLAFDGNIESNGGAFWWDESSNRTVAVRGELILQALDKVYHANALLKEIDAPN